jgi:hypothetical protein
MKKLTPTKRFIEGFILFKGVMDRIISEQLLIICGGKGLIYVIPIILINLQNIIISTCVIEPLPKLAVALIN